MVPLLHSDVVFALISLSVYIKSAVHLTGAKNVVSWFLDQVILIINGLSVHHNLNHLKKK